MTRREKHNIESNCVSFDDDCYAETSSYHSNIAAMDRKEMEVVKSVYRTGENFVNHLKQKLKHVLGA